MPVRLSALLLLAAIAPAKAETGEARRPAFVCQETVTAGTLAGVTPEGEFRLAGGGVMRLADIRLPPTGEAARRAHLWLSSLAGSAVRLREVGPPDRWGRAAAIIELPGEEPIDIGELLVAEGLAVVDAGQRDIVCRPELLTAETGARRNRAGLWREGFWPLPATSLEELIRRARSFAIVEGRVVSVGERRERTYLNFGRDWSRDFNVTIPRRSWEALKLRGITAASLTRRIVRVRGLLEMRRTPTLDLTVPDMLEVVDQPSDRTGGR